MMQLNKPAQPHARCNAQLIRSPLLQCVQAYWDHLARVRSIPFRRDFSPLELPGKVWSRLFLVDIIRDGQSYRIRLMGEYIVSALGHNYTGCEFVESQIPGCQDMVTLRLLRRLTMTMLPQHYFGPTSFRTADWYSDVEQIIMPLCDDDGRLSVAIGAIDYPYRAE